MLDQKLQTFLTVVELRSYTLAAQALHITQPAVSQHIRKLEEPSSSTSQAISSPSPEREN